MNDHRTNYAMKPAGVLMGLLLLVTPAAAHAAGPAADRPNIVFILVDDMPFAGPSITGNALLETPHIDRIAREGMLFSRAYAEPVCGPSRVTLMTGQFSGRHGRTDNPPGVHPHAHAGAAPAAAGSRCDVPVHFADFLPTLCAAAGTAIPSDWPLYGVSLLPLLAGGTLPERTLCNGRDEWLKNTAPATVTPRVSR